jgi:hypothetical protein
MTLVSSVSESLESLIGDARVVIYYRNMFEIQATGCFRPYKQYLLIQKLERDKRSSLIGSSGQWRRERKFYWAADFADDAAVLERVRRVESVPDEVSGLSGETSPASFFSSSAILTKKQKGTF